MTSITEEQAMATEAAAPAEGPEATTKAKAAPRKRRVAPGKERSSKKTTSAKRVPKAPGKGNPDKPGNAREGSKTASVLALLQRAKGATLAEIMEATSWQAHSVRGFISGTLGKKMGLKIESTKRENGERIYSVPK